MEFASSDPGVTFLYYHKLVGSDDSEAQARLPDCPRLAHGNENLCRPNASGIIDQCANSQHRRSLWLTCPTEKTPEIYQRVGFLTQLSLLCAAANLKKCHNRKCAETFKVMEAEAPPCSWGPFREWALVAMSCQERLEEVLRDNLPRGLTLADKFSRPHTHLVNAVHGCCQILENTSPVQDLFVPLHDGFLAPAVDLNEICNIIYWMAQIQAAKNVQIAMLPHWGHRYLPSLVTGPAIRAASEKVHSLELCSFRFWNLVDLAERKETDLPAIVNTLNVEYRRQILRHEYHDKCAATKCQYSHKDSTKVGQLHICGSDCGRYTFPMDKLAEALELGDTTTWSLDVETPDLHNPEKPYIAISHVWADGTGVGVQSQGMVNKCLFDYFSDIAKYLKCEGVWWDALSIPLEPKARSKAIARLHKNYSTAKCTVVHDLYLTNMEFKDPATACLAIVLSPWFTRGWTALELCMSTKVVVLFKGSKKDKPEVKDLDKDILAKSPGRVSRTHWLASTIISRLRKSEINYLDDILAILRPRSTSWVRDRTVIAALLTQIPNCDFSGSEGAMTRDIILHLGFVPYSSLLHGRPTMFTKGPFSWCPATLDDMPIDLRVDLEDQAARRARLLRVENGGAVVGTWYYELVAAHQVKKNQIQPHGDHISVAVTFHNALLEWQNCLILRERKADNGLALLATTVGLTTENDRVLLECNYVGAARIAKDEDDDPTVDDDYRGAFSQEAEVRIGLESGRSECCAREVIEQLQSKRTSLDSNKPEGSNVGPDRKPAGGSRNHDKGDAVILGQQTALKNDYIYPWYSCPGTRYLPDPSIDEDEEIADDSDEASALRIRENLSRAFRNTNATEILHLLISQNIEVSTDVLEQLSFCQLAKLSFVYFSNNFPREAILASERAACLLSTLSPHGDLAVLEALCILGKVSWRTKQLDIADRFYQTLIDCSNPLRMQEEQWKWRAHGEQCLLLIELNQLARASESYRKTWKAFQDLPAPEDMFGYDALARLGISYFTRDMEQEEAEAVYSEALSALERGLGKNHAIVIITARMLASVLLNKGDIAAAEDILSSILPRFEKIAGANHLLTLSTEYDLYRARIFQRKITAPGSLSTLMDRIQGHLGVEHWLTRLAALATARLYFTNEEYTEAVRVLETAKQRGATQDPLQLFLAACAQRDLGMAYSMLGGDAAKGEYEAALQALRNLQLCEHLEWYTTLFCLGVAHQETRDYTVAEKALVDSIGGLERLCGPCHLETREIVLKLGRICGKHVLDPSHDVEASHVLRAVHGLKALLERCGDVSGSNGRVKWALAQYKDEFGIGNNNAPDGIAASVDNGDTDLEENEILVKNQAIALKGQDTDSDDEQDGLDDASDVSGVVVRVGSREGPFKERDRVMGQVAYASTKDERHSGFQTYTVLLTHMTAHIPRTLAFDRAAAIPSSAAIAAMALFSKSHLGLNLPSMPFKPPGDKFVLVWGGGTTSIGCSAVQLAVAAGFGVIASALPKDFGYMREIGATLPVDCSSPTLVDDLREKLDGKQVVGAIDIVAAHDIEAANIKDDPELSQPIYQFLQKALAEGRYVCAPDPNVNINGSAVQASLEAHRKVVYLL